MQNCTRGRNSTREWGANEPPAILCIIRIGMERTTRYLDDLKSVHVAEEKLRANFEELQSARSRVGEPTVEERFTD